MPIYVYGCNACGAVEEHIQRFSDAPLTECSSCGGPLEKQVTAAAFQLKGGGWYKDGYASAKGDKPSTSADSAGSGSKSADSSGSSGSDSGSKGSSGAGGSGSSGSGGSGSGGSGSGGSGSGGSSGSSTTAAAE